MGSPSYYKTADVSSNFSNLKRMSNLEIKVLLQSKRDCRIVEVCNVLQIGTPFAHLGVVYEVADIFEFYDVTMMICHERTSIVSPDKLCSYDGE
jgi:hypothetical protein